jgi:hypothetical protein
MCWPDGVDMLSVDDLHAARKLDWRWRRVYGIMNWKPFGMAFGVLYQISEGGFDEYKEFDEG